MHWNVYPLRMARPLRIEFSGALYHVTARGDRHEAIFVDNEDREALLQLLGEACRRFELTTHAYCLMGNHYHFVLETARPNLSRALRHLNGVYTQRFNRRHGRVGHVFQGRYKAIVVDREAYYLEVVRYVLLNPVRAKLVKHARQWEWSSYRAVMGLAPAMGGVDVQGLLWHVGASAGRARAVFARFIDEGAGQGTLWAKLNGQIYLGDEHFAERLRKRVASAGLSSEIPRLQRRGRVLPLAEYQRRHRVRDEAMALAYRSGHHTMQAIARHFGVHYATVSRAVRKVSQD
jgi:putative transposase